MTRTTFYIFSTTILLIAAATLCSAAKAAASPVYMANEGITFQDTSRPTPADTLRYPIRDRRGDKLSNPSRNAFDLKDPANITDSIEYDPKTKRYYIVEKVGGTYFRKPTYLTFDEYMRIVSRKQENDYFKKRGDILSDLNRKMMVPKLIVSDGLFNRLFGNGKVDIKPQGNVDLTLGYQGQNIKNPTLPERARKTGNLDFDMNANLSVIANIGDKLKLPINYNTQANFDFENQLKLDYTGKDDEIIKRIEAGNVSFSSKGTLIPGAQSLFGIKTQLQFGKLFVTAVLANQRGQSQSMALQGGSASSSFEFKANDYEENRHFLMSQYFRNNYNTAMANLPVVNSQIQILRMEVWITNRNGSTTDTRDVVGLMDLGESNPFSPAVQPLAPLPNGMPDNGVNNLYQRLNNDPSARNSSFVTSRLNSMGLTQVQDFEKTFARKLNSSEYYFNPQVGFLSLNQPLQSDEVLGVAFQYTYNGRTYQVGEFSQDVVPDTTNVTSGNQKVLFLKLLKATSQRPNLPIWDLMMKNVYALRTPDGSYLSSVQPADFKLNVLYEEPSLGQKRYLPEGPRSGQPLLSILNLDRLNNQRDPQPDGVFDFIDGFTIISQQARVIFPLLEPFGSDLARVAFQGSPPELIQKYAYTPLYDTIKEIAKTYSNLDRFIISGTAKGQSSSEIQLGAFNVPQGSVNVTSGGQVLKEGIDYSVDYSLGTVKIINSAILNAGLPVNVSYENNAGFGIQQRNFTGLRLDYMALATAARSLSFGASVVKLGERPFFTKMSYNEDPIKNTMYGLDFNYRSEVPKLTRLLDKLPFYSTNEMSTITAYGEGAVLKPGHPAQIGKGSSGLIYIDDFEGTRNSIDLRFPLTSWSLASTPQGNGLFPEASLSDSLPYGYNRAKMAWYNIEPNLQDGKGSNNPVKGLGADYFGDPRIRAVQQQQIYPARSLDYGQSQLVTFDMSYYPDERGPYNFDARAGSVDPSGKLLNPKQRWGGIMRGLDQVDFETGNVEFIEFWLQDPFLKKPNSTGGQLYFNLGNVSEDVLKDGRRSFENGLPTPNIKAEVDATTKWGQVPSNPIQVTQAFSNDPADRPFQDVGFDGLDNASESVKFQAYLSQLATNFGVGSQAYLNAVADPASDDFRNYRDGVYDKSNADILARYKNINSPQGNSPIATASDNTTSAFTLTPDQEDLNRDNTLNELEEYFQYKLDLVPGQLQVGQNYITDMITVNPDVPGSVQEKWYLMRIPIADYQQKVGNIPDFKSIRFMRMFLTGFEDSVTCRFAKLELVRNQWRRFTSEVDTTGDQKPIPDNSATTINVLAVNVEENSKRQPINYVIPPGIERVQQLSNNNVNLLQNEQALSMQVCNLERGDARGVFKTLNLDLRQYGKMQMFVHTESVTGQTGLKNDDLSAVIRIGNDIIGNYYEVKIPLKVTAFGAAIDTLVWPTANALDLDLSRLTTLKMRRNNTTPSNNYYKETDADGKTYAILGNPNLGEVRSVFLGVENTKLPVACTEAWFNELRLSSIDEHGGYAALGRVDFKLADLGTLSVSGSVRSIGFGTLEQRVNERSRENTTQFDVATNLELGKLLPAKAAMSIPVYAGITQTVSTPEYDPYDLDLKLKDKIANASPEQRDSIRNDAIDIVTVKTLNFTNVKKMNTTGKKQRIWSVENLDISYSYTSQAHRSPLIESDEVVKHRAGLGYNYTSTPKYWEPFKKLIKAKSPWYNLVKDFNLNPNPALLSFRADINRQFGAFRARNVGGPKGGIPETFDKYFTFDRYYNARWDLTRSLNIDFTATNKARVDEDTGRLDKQERERLKRNFFKGGRNTLYDQTLNITYTLPTSKLPFLDWTTFRVGYVARYSWMAASLDSLARALGNFVNNGQDKNVTGELDFTRLYSKSRLLRALDWDAPKPLPPSPAAPKNASDTTKNGKPAKVKRAPGELPQLNLAIKVVGRLITSFKRMSINYSETGTTNLAGYMDSTRMFGMNTRNNFAPGWDFVLGRQPDTNYINKFAQKGLLTHSTLFNTLNRQDYNQRLSITAQLIPVRDLTIDLNLDKTFGKTYSELFKDTLGNSNLVRLNPYSAGSFSVSYISFQTMFEKFQPNEVSKTFEQFEANRVLLSQRLGKANPYAAGAPVDQEGYVQGYGKYAQDVLIPAFIAAYTKQDPNSVPLIKQSNPNTRSNPFSGILPKPNWRITYNGLTRIPGMEKIFTNFTVTHGYNSTLSMNSFNSALLFRDPFSLGYPVFQDSVSGNYVPYFLVPNITISEAFAPMIDLDMQFTNDLSARFEYKKSRQLSLSLIDYQLSESRSTEFTIGGGLRKRGFKLPFKLPFTKKDAKAGTNDVNFRLDLSLRDDATANSRLDQDAALPTSGQKVVTISPSVDYVLNNRINLKFYFDQRRVEPKVSTSPPITTTRAGVQIRISLAQ